MSQTAVTSPAAWEHELRGRLSGHRLAGELRISEDDLAEIECQVETLLQSGLSARGLRVSYPALLVVYLTGVGVYRYEAGSYWPNVRIARRLLGGVC